MSILKSVLPKIEVNYDAFETQEMLYYQKYILVSVFKGHIGYYCEWFLVEK